MQTEARFGPAHTRLGRWARASPFNIQKESRSWHLHHVLFFHNAPSGKQATSRPANFKVQSALGVLERPRCLGIWLQSNFAGYLVALVK